MGSDRLCGLSFSSHVQSIISNDNQFFVFSGIIDCRRQERLSIFLPNIFNIIDQGHGLLSP